MEKSLFLLCKFKGFTLPIKYTEGFYFNDLVNKLCGKWSELMPNCLSISYCLAGHSHCVLDNDEHLELMVGLAFSCGVDRVDVSISCSSLVEGSISCVGECSSSSGKRDRMEVDCESDFLPSLYSREEIPLLSHGWVNCIKEVGQRFSKGVVEFRDALLKYSIHSGFDFDFIKNDKERVTAHCKRRADYGCLWSVHARVDKSDNSFVIKEFHNVHTCGSAVRTIKHRRMNSSLIGGLISNELRSKPLTSVSEVVYDFKKNYGAEISYRRAWLGVEKAKGCVFGDYSSSFDELCWYVEAAKDSNPGSVFDMEFDVDKKGRHFKRLFFGFEACIYGFNFCRPLLFLDGTFLKGRHKGCLLAGTGKDGNQGLYPLCFAIVDAESYESWHWFLLKLSVILAPGRDMVFVTDRNGGLLRALAEVFPSSGHAFCLMHLKNNLKSHLQVKDSKFKKYLLNLFTKCAYAPTVELFDELFEKFKHDCGRSIGKFLVDLPNERWCNAYFQGKRYGEMSTNAAESFNSWIRAERHLFSTNLVDALRVKLMEQFSCRRDLGNKWNCAVCPSMEAKLEKAFEDTKSWVVRKCSDDVYEVQLDQSIVVDIKKRSCSCRMWEINSFPCKHAFCAIKMSGRDLNCFVDDYYLVRSYCESYSHSICPIGTLWKANEVVKDDVILPPLCKKPVGRPRTERIASRGEVQAIRCSRCGKMGNHNRKTCKEALV